MPYQPDTRSIRLHYIADELEEEGWYTKAYSIRALVNERDDLLIENAALHLTNAFRRMFKRRMGGCVK